MKHSFAVVLLALLTFSAAGFAAHAQAATAPVEVVATFSILGDLAQQVGGDIVHVTTLVGPDGDAHIYKPTPKASLALASADVVIENGLGLEGWMDRLIPASGFKGSVVVASEGVAPRRMDAKEDAGKDNNDNHDNTDNNDNNDNNKQSGSASGVRGHAALHGGRAIDPHAWQDISNARIYARNIAKALAGLRPSQAAEIMARAKAYDAELERLDGWVRAEIGSIAPARRKVITSHDAFGYFGAAYGVAFLAPQGLSTEVEPTATEAARLIEQMKAEKITRVFFENMASPKLVQQLAKDAGAGVGEPVYSDALSKAGGPAATYVAMFRHNVSAFKDAMGMNGR